MITHAIVYPKKHKWDPDPTPQVIWGYVDMEEVLNRHGHPNAILKYNVHLCPIKEASDD